MHCEQCQKEVTEDACPHCGRNVRPISAETAGSSTRDASDPVALRLQIIEDIKADQFPPHIAELNVSNTLKRTFTFYERFGVEEQFGLAVALPKEERLFFKDMSFKQRYALTKLLQAHIWWAFFFGPLYYFFSGMWRKGIALLGAVIAFCLVFDLGYALIIGGETSRHLDFGLAVGIGYMLSMTACYDKYRLLVKHEQGFWW